MLDVDSIDRQIFLDLEELGKRWHINSKTVTYILEKYNLEIHIADVDIRFKEWDNDQIKIYRFGDDTTIYLRRSVIKDFEQANEDLFKKIKEQSSIEPRPEFLLDDEWRSYRKKTREARKKGNYTDEQAHYWRSRAVFRYLNPAVLNEEQVTKLDFIQKRLQEIYPDIIQFGCEQVSYDSCDVEQWIVDPCPLPDANDKKPKPWEDSISDKSQETQMKRKSRLRECVQAIALIMFSRNTGLTDEAFIQTFSQDNVQKILDIARVDDSSVRESEWEPSEKLVRDWVKDLMRWIHPVSKKVTVP